MLDSTKKTVLVVDDQEISIFIINEQLKNDFNVVSSTNSIDAIKLAEIHCPDIILLDINMPGKTGIEICRDLKNNQETKHIPVILITSAGHDESEIEGFNVGAVDYFTKPVKPELMKIRINHQIKIAEKTKNLESLATTDGLTGICNRRQFDNKFDEACKYASRKSQNLCVMIIDIDHFKLYNDNYGHLQGDVVLKKIADALTSTISRPYDLVARFGGEEFAVIAGDICPESSKKFAKQIQETIKNLKIPHEYSPTSDYITACVGVAVSHDNGAHIDPYTFIDLADQALYNAKKNGRNSISYLGYRP